jgi:hypothetical protein
VAGQIVCYAPILAEPGEKKPYKNRSLKNKFKQTLEDEMTNKTTENFLQVMATFDWPEPKPISYRLYYLDDGSPQCYTMDDLPGKYIEIDQEAFAIRSWNVRVIDQKLVVIPPPVITKKLIPSDRGTPCHLQDVCVVVYEHEPNTKWTLTTNETY